MLEFNLEHLSSGYMQNHQVGGVVYLEMLYPLLGYSVLDGGFSKFRIPFLGYYSIFWYILVPLFRETAR